MLSGGTCRWLTSRRLPWLTSSSVAPSSDKGRWSATQLVSRFGLLVAWVIVIVIFSVLSPAVFATTRDLQVTLSTQSVLVMLSLSLVVALAAGEYDLSVAGVLRTLLCACGVADVIHGWPIIPTLLVALGGGVAVGVVNALLIVGVGIDSLVATLGMGTLLAGAAIGINDISVAGVSPALVSVFRTPFLGVQMGFWFAVVLTLVCWYVLTHTPLGRYVFVVGAGREVARLTGLRVNAIRAGSLIVASTLAAFAGVALSGLQGAADPSTGPTYLLPAFACAYLGSTSIQPGRFNAWGAFAAVYFLATGITGLQILGLSGWIDQVFYGGSLIVAVILSHMARRRTGMA